MDRTLSEVVKLTGAKRRSVQLWADAGAIRLVEGTDRAGTGVHKRFSVGEVRIIALLMPLAKWGVPIGWLRYFASEFRKALAKSTAIRGSRYTTKERLARALRRAIAGEGKNYLLFMHQEKALWFEVITDEESPARVNLSKCFEGLLSTYSMMGVLDLNACLHGLGD